MTVPIFRLGCCGVESRGAESASNTTYNMPVPTVLGSVDADAAVISGSICSREELLHRVSPAIMKTIHENPITLGNLAEVRSGGDSGRLAVSNRLFSLDESVQELASLKDVPGGEGGLVLEATAAGEGRDPSGLAEISRRSGLSIVMAASVKEVHTILDVSLYSYYCCTPSVAGFS